MNLEACGSYVSMLRARRMEEDTSRTLRAQRRADVVIANSESFRRRNTQTRRCVMEAKLGMASQIEHHLFAMLDEQSKWRHVMFQNVLDRQEQEHSAREQQDQLETQHLEHLAQQEAAICVETARDDTTRWNDLLRKRRAAEHRANTEACHVVVDSVLDLVGRVVDFVATNDLMDEPAKPAAVGSGVVHQQEAPRSMFDRVPKIVFAEWKRSAVFATEEDTIANVVANHVRLALPGLEAGAALGVVPGVAATAGHNEQSHNFGTAATALAGGAAPAATATGAPSDVHNAFFAVLTRKMQQLHYPRPAPSKPLTARAAASIVLLGPKFSGKTVVAKAVCEGLGLQYVSDVSLVGDALQALEKELTPEELADPNSCALIDLAVEVRRTLQDGQPVAHDLIAKLALHRLTTLPEGSAGVLFDGAPFTVAAFRSVERALSGYDESRVRVIPDELLAPGFPSLLNGVDESVFVLEKPDPTAAAGAGGAAGDAISPAKDTKKPDPPSKPAKKDAKRGKDEVEEPLPPIELPVVEPVPPLTEEEEEILRSAEKDYDVSGLSSVIHIDCSVEEIFRRFAGLRGDSETGRQYHLTFDPPPLDRMPFVIAKDRTDTDTAKLHSALASYEGAWAESKAWLAHFKGLLTQVSNDSSELGALTEQVTAVAAEAVGRARQDYDTATEAERILEERREMEELYTERLAARDHTRRQLAAIYTERGVDPLPAELLEPPKPVDESRVLAVPPALPRLYLLCLGKFTAFYRSSVYQVHRELVAMIRAAYEEGTSCLKQFAAFWKTPDTRDATLFAFVREFNEMQPALRRDPQGKDELHLRADALRDALWHMVDKRRDDANALIESVSNHTAFLDSWCDAARVLGASLIQLEVERFFMVKQLATLFFGALRGESQTVDEGETTLDIIPAPRSSAEPAVPEAGHAVVKPGGAKEKAKPPPKKVSAPPVHRGSTITGPDGDGHDGPRSEDPLTNVVDKALLAVRTATDRLTHAVPSSAVQAIKAAPKKDAKVAAADATGAAEAPTAGTYALPVVNAEMELVKKRITFLADFTRQILEDGTTRNAVIRAKMQQRLRQRFLREIAAVNAAVFHMRCAIEEERPVLFMPRLEGDVFAVDHGHPLVVQEKSHITDITLPPQQQQQQQQQQQPQSQQENINVSQSSGKASAGRKVTSFLTYERACELVQLFKKIAPGFLIYRQDFLAIVRQEDYSAPRVRTATPAVVFSRFDSAKCDAIDWREFIVHVLLWSEDRLAPSDEVAEVSEADTLARGGFGTLENRNPFYIEGPALYHLYDLKADLGPELLLQEDWEESPIFFESMMDAERHDLIRSVLWHTFSTMHSIPSNNPKIPATTQLAIEPNTLLLFLCSDEQPLRGIQKAFAMGSTTTDETYSLTREGLFDVMHFSACNPTTLGLFDPHDWEAVDALFLPGGPDAISFADVCSTLPGRIMLNNTVLFQMKSFLA